MAPVALDPIERRRERRSSGGGALWRAHAVLRPGQPVTLLNISSRAALVESAARLRPGARTEVLLAGVHTRASVGGRLDRCYVAAIEPMRYRGVLVFDERVDVGDE
ncbi:MAG: hypothetical protein K2Y23_10205 [Cyanobacteria bacterium]|nr:hypothetical protein [Cyanobacteriota bacterium]